MAGGACSRSCTKNSTRVAGTALAILERNQPGVIANDLEACNAHKTLPEAGKSVKCPTLLVLGDGDLMTPSRNAKQPGRDHP